MKFRSYIVAIILFIAVLTVYFLKTEQSIRLHANISSKAEKELLFDNYSKLLYKCINFPGMNYIAFKQALKGYYLLKSKNKLNNSKILTVIDFSKSSNDERLYVVDMENNKLLYKSLVAHGRNSGEEYATKFSNIPESYMSSLGFYVTAETYTGKHGLSLRLDGKEPSINNNARNRDIVIHAADYVCNDFINKCGRLGRSYGCPAIPKDNYDVMIDCLKEGSCIYAYYPDKNYFNTSFLLNDKSYLEGFSKDYSLSK